MSLLDNNKEEALLFLTHVWHESQGLRFINLVEATRNRKKCFVLLDAGNEQAVDAWKNFLGKTDDANNIYLFEVDKLEKSLGYKFYAEGQLVPGSTHYPLIEFARKFKYNRYWLVEFDVILRGAWSDFFSFFENDNSDLILSHLTSYHSSPKWSWWPSLRMPVAVLNKLAKEGTEILQKGFFPIYRISRASIDTIDRAHMEGWGGHYEAVVPTVLKNNQLTIKDFNDFNNFYLPGPHGPLDGRPPYSSLRWRPEVEPSELNDSVGLRIFHPVKS